MEVEQDSQPKETRSFLASAEINVSENRGKVIGNQFILNLWEKFPFKQAAKKGRLVLFIVAIILAGGVLNSDAFIEIHAIHPIFAYSMIALAVMMAGFWLITVNASWIGTDRVKQSKWFLATVVLVLYGLSVSYPYWCRSVGFCKKAKWDPVLLPSLVASAYAGQQAPADLSIENVVVDRTRSSFYLKDAYTSFFAKNKDVPRRSLEFDRRMQSVFETASCRGIDGEKPIEEALPIWRTILKRRPDLRLAAKLGDLSGYRDLIQMGGVDTFFKAIPNASERVTLKNDNPGDFDIIMRWLSNCVGLADPVLIWTLHNNSTRTLLVTAVDYDVMDIGQVMGGGPGAVEVTDVEHHDLQYEKGLQKRDLMPHITLPAKSTISIRIRYKLEAKDYGLTWLVRANFRCSDGTVASSEELEIFSAKNPKP